MPEEKLTDEEKAKLEEGLKSASISDAELRDLARGEDASGTRPVETGEDLLSAAATALEFVEGMTPPEPRAEAAAVDKEAVAGFDALLRKLETLRSDISSLQRGVVGVFAAQLLTFRGKVVELKSSISEQMVERLKMQFLKGVIESTFVDIVDAQFAMLEKELVDKIVDQTQERFKEFATRVRESEVDLRTTIIEQQDIVRSFMKTLEDDSLAVREELREKENEASKLEREIQKLQSQIDMGEASGISSKELSRKVGELEAKIDSLRQDLVKKDTVIAAKESDIGKQKASYDELRAKLGETQSELEVYKTEKAAPKAKSTKTDTEFAALQHKAALLEATVAEKRKEAETTTAMVKELERKLKDAALEKKSAEESAQKRLKELDSVQSKILEVKELEEKAYNLEKEAKEAHDKIAIVEMQREAYEKATRLMEKERDMALEVRDVANERAERYIRVLGLEAHTKVLLIVDEVGSISFTELGKTLGIAAGLAAKHARELAKLGVIKIEGEKAVSTLRKLDIKEGEVKV